MFPLVWNLFHWPAFVNVGIVPVGVAEQGEAVHSIVTLDEVFCFLDPILLDGLHVVTKDGGVARLLIRFDV